MTFVNRDLKTCLKRRHNMKRLKFAMLINGKVLTEANRPGNKVIRLDVSKVEAAEQILEFESR